MSIEIAATPSTTTAVIERDDSDTRLRPHPVVVGTEVAADRIPSPVGYCRPRLLGVGLIGCRRRAGRSSARWSQATGQPDPVANRKEDDPKRSGGPTRVDR